MSKTPLEKLDAVTAIATSPGNAHADEYMRGMANGLILAQAIMNECEPIYIDPPVPVVRPKVNVPPEIQQAVNDITAR